MRRLLLPVLIAVAAFTVPASPAAANQQSMFSIMMDDDLLLYRGDDARDRSMRRMKGLGVDFVRVTVLWEVVAQNAKVDRFGKKRRKFKADRHGTYPKQNWDKYDRLVRAGQTLGIGIYFNVTGPGPAWAHNKAPKSQKAFQRTWDPRAKEFYKFVKAVGTRYDGTQRDENDGAKTLPRVGFWSIYNEPNQPGWLMPQYKKVGSKVVAWSPVMYRELWRQGRAALDDTEHDNDIVLAGETAPLGSGQTNVKSPIRPKKFIRELLCIDPAGRTYTGGAALKRKCSGLKKVGTFKYTAWAHHPYTKDLKPTARDAHKDSITMANASELTALLDQLAAKTNRLPELNLSMMTEFGYETDPPDPFSGVKPELQAEYINLGDYLAWKDPRIVAQTQFLLQDVDPVKRERKNSKKYWFTYQSGLFYNDGRPKPAGAAYRLPLVVVGRGIDSVGQEGTSLWGHLRFLPPNFSTSLSLQFRPQGAADFSTIGDPVPVDPGGYFETVKAVGGPGTWRAVWIEPNSQVPFVSREADVTG